MWYQASVCFVLALTQGISSIPLSYKQTRQSNGSPSEDEIMNCIVEVLSIVSTENVDELSKSCRLMLNIAARRKELEFLPEDVSSNGRMSSDDYDDISSQLAGIEANYDGGKYDFLPSSSKRSSSASAEVMTPDEEDALRDIIRKEIEASLSENMKRSSSSFDTDDLVYDDDSDDDDVDDGDVDDQIMVANDKNGDEEFLVIPMSYLNELEGLDQKIATGKVAKKSASDVGLPKGEEIIDLEEEFLPKEEEGEVAVKDMENFMKLEQDLEALSKDFKLLDIEKK